MFSDATKADDLAQAIAAAMVAAGEWSAKPTENDGNRPKPT
jgi:hypothetical protein